MPKNFNFKIKHVNKNKKILKKSKKRMRKIMRKNFYFLVALKM